MGIDYSLICIGIIFTEKWEKTGDEVLKAFLQPELLFMSTFSIDSFSKCASFSVIPFSIVAFSMNVTFSDRHFQPVWNHFRLLIF